MKEIRLGFCEVDERFLPSGVTFADIFEAIAESWPNWVRDSDLLMLDVSECDRQVVNQGFQSGFLDEEITRSTGMQRAQAAIASRGPLFESYASRDEELSSHLVIAHDLAYTVGQDTSRQA